MANKIAGRSRVNSIISHFEEAGYEFINWTADGEYDSPKIELKTPATGTKITVAVERNHIEVGVWHGGSMNYKKFKTAADYELNRGL